MDEVMNDRPLVSIIMIFLNEERFIEEAIASILHQSYTDWELWLVDDGSTDRSTAIAKQYARQYHHQIYYLDHNNHQNQGMSASRNLGINQAKGKYIGFLDADDVWTSSKLKQQVAILEKHPEAALVCGRTQWWYSWTGKPEDEHRDFLQQYNLKLDQLIKAPQVLLQFLQDEWASLCDILVRRQLVLDVGGYEDQFRGMYEDQVFHFKLCLNHAVFVSSKCWYHYRQRTDSCTSNAHNAGQYKETRKYFLNWVEEYILQQGSSNPLVSQLIQKELWWLRHPLLSRISNFKHTIIKEMKNSLKRIAQKILPQQTQNWLRTLIHNYQFQPPLGKVNFGDFRKLTPISEIFGFDRGLPVDRYYVEKFLNTEASLIKGRVLEIGDDTYTLQFGKDRVSKSDILHVTDDNPKATIIGDLTTADHIPSDAFDCVILAQTLHLIYDFKAALKTIRRILKPGGILLATFPGISPKSNDEWADYWCWAFTAASARRMFAETFPQADVEIETHGSVLSSIAFLQGLSAHELRPEELEYHDPRYELLITVKAKKA